MVGFESTLAGGTGATLGCGEAVLEYTEVAEAAGFEDEVNWLNGEKFDLDAVGAEWESTGSVLYGTGVTLEGIWTGLDGVEASLSDTAVVFDDIAATEDEGALGFGVGDFGAVWAGLGPKNVENVCPLASTGWTLACAVGFESTLVGGFGAVFASGLAGGLLSSAADEEKNEDPNVLGLQPDVNDDK